LRRRLRRESSWPVPGDAGTTEASRSSRRYGVEWSTQWHPLHWLLFDSDLSWSHARFTSPDPDPNVTGSYIPGSIEWAASAGVAAGSANRSRRTGVGELEDMTRVRVRIRPIDLPHGPRETMAKLRGDAPH